ncbi:hypothetical protein ACS5NO_16850 [Larkinella sp. GY13]|uniref:hypothetical protein n=1 Tax=Larkinella sp. GY13 TaxID=3453720 RepID=UPI003EEDEB06
MEREWGLANTMGVGEHDGGWRTRWGLPERDGGCPNAMGVGCPNAMGVGCPNAMGVARTRWGLANTMGGLANRMTSTNPIASTPPGRYPGLVMKAFQAGLISAK